MRISAKDLGFMVDRFMYMIDSSNIRYAEDLDKLIGDSFSVQECDDIFSVEKRPSVRQTECYAISYIRQENGIRMGIPIEARINEELDYSQITFKSAEIIEGYQRNMFGFDSFGNHLYSVKRDKAGIDIVKRDLENIKRIC